MNQPISIVIPVHNKEKYIERTLKSVLSQSYPNFELILVNDGSIDSSGEICDKYASIDIRIRVIHQKNGGVSNARNTGIKAAANELIAFIDADDWWDSEFLKQMLGLIEHYPEINIYSAKYARIQNGNIISGENFFSADEKFISFDLIEQCAAKVQFPIHTSSVIIRKQAIVKAGYFDERIAMFEDYDLFVRIALASKVAYLNTLLPITFYNLDVPAESKARGVIPNIEKHWIYYFEKYNEDVKSNHYLKILLDNAIVTQLLDRKILPGYRKEVKRFISKVDRRNISFKYKIIYSVPYFIGNAIVQINKTIKKMFFLYY